MDRNRTGEIDRSELDCEEFREVLRQIITPQSAVGSGGVSYARVQQNIEQCVDFCLRKADFNNDRSLSFEEFKSFLVVLRSSQGAGHTADLIFALFDLDQDNRINRSEFREIFRFYLGHHPTAEEFNTEWGRLDAGQNDEVSRKEYIRWLQTSANPVFRQHAPPLRGYSSDSLSTLKAIGKKRQSIGGGGKSAMSRTLPGLEELEKNMGRVKPRWNQNFNTRKNMNHEIPAQQRVLFSRPQSLPELTRYYELHRGFNGNADRMASLPDQRRHKAVLSTESTAAMMPERDGPGGTMRNPLSGRVVEWNDHWQEPASLKQKPLPVTLLFRCPGKPPPSLLARCEEDF